MSFLSKLMDRSGAYRLAFIVGGVVVLIDQLTKNWARDTFAGEPPREVLGEWLRFTYAKNPGAAFSSFTGSGQVIGVIAIGVAVFLLYLVGKSQRRVEVISLGLIFGGALGNLADRVLRGEDSWTVP